MKESQGSKQRLNAYIYDFLVKSALHGSAGTFFEEAGLREDSDNGNSNSSVKRGVVVVDSPQGYLYEWWKIFWDLCTVRSKRGDGGTTGLPAMQAYYKLWSEKNAQENALMTQEINAASLQQTSEDAGEYRNEEVDASRLSLVVSSVPLQPSLRKVPPVSSKRVEKQKHYKKRVLREERQYEQNLFMRRSNVSTDRTAHVNAVPHHAGTRASLPSQEVPAFDLQSFEYDPDFLLFTSPETAPLPVDFPPTHGEDTSFLDNSSERSFNFLNGM